MDSNTRRYVIVVLLISLLCLTAAITAMVPAAGAEEAWVAQESPVTKRLNGVSAADVNHIWAVGEGGTILYSDGGMWYKEQSGTKIGLWGVSALDPKHVWAVGEGGTILFFDGTEWKSQACPVTQWLNSVHALDANHVWAVGEGGKVVFFDGSSWSEQPTPTTNMLTGVRAVAHNKVWAVGWSGTVLYFNGSTWNTRPSPTGYDLYDVAAADAEHVWITGDASKIYLWDGTKWKKTNSAGWGNSLRCIAAVSPNLAYGAGGGNEGDPGGVQKWDGTSWKPYSSGVESTLTMFHDIDGLDADNVWIVGQGGTIYRSAGGSRTRTLYFAEGCTREGFSEWLCLQNPGSKEIDVKATYMLFGGVPLEKVYTLKPTSRTSVNVNNEVGPGHDVAVQLESEADFYAERPMYFNYKQDQPGFSWTGGHCATGARAPRRDWYFAEGTTREGFEEWLCIQNPNDFMVEVIVDYVSAGAYTQQKKYDIEGKSRISVFVNGDVGPNQDVSAHVHSDSGIVAERPMYFNYRGRWTGGHNVMGTDSPRTAWYFAEGSTGRGFEEWLAVQNANNSNANLKVRFLKTDGDEIVRNYTVGANSRWTLDVAGEVGSGVDSSMVVESDQPVVAERPMYFDYKQGEPGYGWTGGHDVVGAPAPKKSWFFAEGCTLNNFDEYICVANTGGSRATVRFRFMLETGDIVGHSIEVGPGRRSTIKVADIVGRGHDVSTEIISTEPVVAERPMYFDYNGWTGGHNVLGF